jgi:hypothetical protein
MPAKAAGKIFAVCLGMSNSGQPDTFHMPNFLKKWGRNAPQIRTALGLIRAGNRCPQDTLRMRIPRL